MVVDGAKEFVAVAVTNNVPGPDATILKRFGEPAWNNPVIRFLDASEADVIPRKDGDYSTGFVLKRMVESLEKAGKTVPEYLKLAVAEYAPTKRERAVFAMYCYWEGEAKLGKLNGVIGTQIGSLDGQEVVDVEFDPTVLTYKSLVQKAKEMDCTHRVYARTDDQLSVAKGLVGNLAARSNKAVDTKTTQQYHLAYYPQYHYLPLTLLQATKINASLANRESPDALLSPSQLALVKVFTKRLTENPKALAELKPDRTYEGIIKYAKALEIRLAK